MKETSVVGKKQVCSRCVCDTAIPGIFFDEEGICNYCHIHDEMEEEYPLGVMGQAKLEKIIKEIKSSGKGKKYDCIVGVSGGRDSTFLLYTAVKLGLRPLAVHFDNGWNSELAVTNIKNILTKLKVDLMTLVVDWDEFKDLQRSFLFASVSDAEVPTDIGIFGTVHKYAAKEGIKYILNGHSFRTEGVMPIGWTYMDGRYVKAIQKKFGTLPLKTFPNFTLWHLLYFTFINKVKNVPLINFIDYKHGKIEKILEKEVGWTYSGGHHHESYYTHFFQSFLLPKKFNIDKRKIEYSAKIRSGQMKREVAFKEIAENLYPYDQELVNYTISKLGFTPAEFEKEIMKKKVKTFHDYPTYYSLVRALKPLIKIAVRLNLIPQVLYQKFFT